MCSHTRLARLDFDAQRGYRVVCLDCGMPVQVERHRFWSLDWPEHTADIPQFVPPPDPMKTDSPE